MVLIGTAIGYQIHTHDDGDVSNGDGDVAIELVDIHLGSLAKDTPHLAGISALVNHGVDFRSQASLSFRIHSNYLTVHSSTR
jgi:hypothetical protein